MAGNLPFSEKLEAIGPEERWFSAAAGACLVGYGLSKVSLRSLAAMAVGGYLVYRGSTGKCPLGDKLEKYSDNLQSMGQSLNERFQNCCHGEEANAPPFEPSSAVNDDLDPVDEAAMESFPASDPPSYSTGTSTPSHPIQ